MSDTFGALTLPVAITDPGGDPGLGKLAAFLQAVINAECSTAFDALKAHATMPAEVACLTAFTVNPRRYTFTDQQLPAIFLHRKEMRHERIDQDTRGAVSNIEVMYLFPRDPYQEVADRVVFANAVAKAVDSALVADVHPAWYDAGDTTPFAAPIVEDLDSIKVAVATSASPVSYSGAALNGVIGTAVMLPRREPTITLSASTGTYAGSATLTYIDWTGATRTAAFALPANGGVTLRLGTDVKQVVSWALPAQNNTAGSLTFGTSANDCAGAGSSIRTRGSFRMLELQEAKPETVKVEALHEDGERFEVRNYDAIEMRINATEELRIDAANPAKFFPINTLPHGLDLDVVQAGFTSSESQP